MSDTIQVELTKDVARKFLREVSLDRDIWLEDVRAAVESALPPEYPEGTVTWVTHRTIKTYRRLAHMHNGRWTFDHDETGVDHSLAAGDILKVEPLRVLADDEIAVKRVRYLDGSAKEPRARVFREHAEGAGAGYVHGQLAHAYADALEAEKK